MRPRILVPALWLLSAAGCDSILETDPVDQVPSNQIIVDGPTARAALAGVYDALQDLSYYGRNLLILADLSADNVEHVGTLQALGELDRHQVRADNTTIEGVWQAIYEGIGRINLILADAPGVPFLDEAERGQILGEAHFLRALHYHDLVKVWGGVPLVLEPIRKASEATGFARASEDEVYQQILSDLDNAEQLMTDDEQTRRASVGAARALRSRVLLYMENWAGAETAADDVLAMHYYSLAAAYEDLFSAEGADTPEDIFRIDFNAVEYNELGYYYLFDGRYETAPTADLFEAYEIGDARHPWSVAEEGGEYQGTKFPTTAGTEDLHVIRLGEVVLNYAEALARQGELEPAMDAYNEIRLRAGLAPHPFTDVTTQDGVIDAILHERRIELALEGHRWPDLVRTSRAVDVLRLSSDQEYQTLYPIPSREIVVAPGLAQNPGY